MPEKVKQGYIQEYKEEHGGQQAQQQKSSVDLVAEANAPLVGLRELFTSLRDDTASKSQSFQKMEETLQELVSMTFRSTWEINDYAAAFWAAKQAAQEYLDSHKRGRWTSRGESRKQTAKQIRDILQSNEEQYIMKLLEAKQMKLKEKGLDEDFNRQAEVTETLIWDEQDAPHPIKEEEVQRVVKSGSIEEKLQLLMDIHRYETYNNLFGPDLKEMGYAYDDDRSSELCNMVLQSIKQEPLQNRLKFVDLACQLQKKGYDALYKTFHEYRNQAPAGIDKQDFAYAKLESSALVNKISALTLITRDIGFEELLGKHAELPMKLNGLIGEVIKHHPESEDVEEIYNEVIIKNASTSRAALKKKYALVTEKVKQEQVKYLIQSGLIVKGDKKKKCTQEDIDALLQKTNDIVYRNLKAMIPKDPE